MERGYECVHDLTEFVLSLTLVVRPQVVSGAVEEAAPFVLHPRCFLSKNRPVFQSKSLQLPKTIKGVEN